MPEDTRGTIRPHDLTEVFIGVRFHARAVDWPMLTPSKAYQAF